MSNEITFIIMKDCYKLCRKLLFWNFISALVAIALLHFILWVENLTGKQNVLAGCLEVPSHVWGAWGMFGYMIGALLFLLILGLLVLIFCTCMRCVSIYFDPSFNKRGAINTNHFQSLTQQHIFALTQRYLCFGGCLYLSKSMICISYLV